MALLRNGDPAPQALLSVLGKQPARVRAAFIFGNPKNACGHGAGGCDPIGTITMKTLTTLTAGVALLGFVACDSKVETSRKEAVESKADALEHKAEGARKDAKVFAADAAKQASLDAIVTKAEADKWLQAYGEAEP